jgi:hypothetical protein
LHVQGVGPPRSDEAIIEDARKLERGLVTTYFALGKLAAEYLQRGEEGVRLRDFAERIEEDVLLVGTALRVRRAFPDGPVGRHSWTVYRTLVANPKRHAILAEREKWAMKDLTARLGRTDRAYLRPGSDAVANAVEALSDPEVVRQAIEASPEARSAVGKAFTGHYNDVAMREADRERTTHPGLVELSEAMQVRGRIDSARRVLLEAVTLVAKLSMDEPEREVLGRRLEPVERLVQTLREYADGSGVSIDDGLRALLAGEEVE